MTSTVDATPAIVRKLLARLAPGAGLDSAALGPPLEVTARVEEARIVAARPLEPTPTRRDVGDDEVPRFSAFVDGSQRSQIIGYYLGVPLVWASVGAVVRERRARRMHTWKYAVSKSVFVPWRLLPAEFLEGLADAGIECVDTLDGGKRSELPQIHPMALVEDAYAAIKTRREKLERQLGEHWCGSVGEPVYVDGPISVSHTLGTAECAVGVVKSHRTIFTGDERSSPVIGLRTGQRSGMLRIASSNRVPVASFYLRVREEPGRGPLFGLVRVEIAEIIASPERADEVSRWILAERAPLSLPDQRWDVLAYGIRDCEQFLEAVC